MAKLTFKGGPMNSGKSIDMIRTAYNYREQGLEILVAKPGVDTKEGRLISTRVRVGNQSLSMESDFVIEPYDDIRGIVLPKMSARAIELFHTGRIESIDSFRYDALLIDEAQFLEPEQVEQLRRIATFDDVSVITYGIEADFQRRLFPGSKRLLELADVREPLITMCHCGSQARYNARLVNGIFTFSGSQVAIDGAESVDYRPLCAEDYERVYAEWENGQKAQQQAVLF